ncbi:hypothetical protein Tco_0491345 [Tanacetum coccineum]
MKMESSSEDGHGAGIFQFWIFALFPFDGGLGGFVQVLFEVLKHRVKEQEESKKLPLAAESKASLCLDSRVVTSIELVEFRKFHVEDIDEVFLKVRKYWFMNFEKRSYHVEFDTWWSLSNNLGASPLEKKGKAKAYPKLLKLEIGAFDRWMEQYKHPIPFDSVLVTFGHRRLAGIGNNRFVQQLVQPEEFVVDDVYEIANECA